MATLLDGTFITFLIPLFVFLLIFVIIYAILSKTDLFGKGQAALNFLGAICIAAVSVFSGNLIKLVGTVTPWIVFIFVILMFLFGMFKWLGLENKEIWSTIGGETVVYIVILLVLLIGLTVAFEPEVSPYDASANASMTVATSANTGIAGKSVKNEALNTITHPRILGALFILIVSSFAIRLLTEK